MWAASPIGGLFSERWGVSEAWLTRTARPLHAGSADILSIPVGWGRGGVSLTGIHGGLLSVPPPGLYGEAPFPKCLPSFPV